MDGMLIFLMVVLACAIAVLAWAALKIKLQVRLLELMFTLIACSAAMGCTIRYFHLQSDHDAIRVTAGLAIGCILAVLILIGAFWGLIWCKRAREERTGVRLAYVMLGWTLPAALLATIHFVGNGVRGQLEFSWWETVAVSSALVILVLSVGVDRTVQKREAAATPGRTNSAPPGRNSG